MNVENRKLFANRDARKRLAEMGGILASSPELMGEAMKFANGGQAQEQEFIINIPGLTSPGEMLRIKESTLMQLGDMFPDLMGQEDVLVEPVELMGEEAMNARPGDAVIGTRINRMMQQSAPEEVVLESAPITSGRERAISGEGALDQFAAPRSSASTPSDMSLIDRIRSTVQSAETVPLFELPEVDFQKLDRDIGSSIQAADRAVQGKMVEVLGDVYQIIADDIRGDIDRIKIIRASTGTEVTDPAIKQAVLSNQRIAGEDMAMAQDVPQGQPRVFAQPESEPEVMFPGELSRAFVPEPLGAEDLMGGSVYPAEEGSSETRLLNAMNPAFDSFGGDLLARNSDAEDLMAGPIYPAEEGFSETNADRFNEALSARPRLADQNSAVNPSENLMSVARKDPFDLPVRESSSVLEMSRRASGNNETPEPETAEASTEKSTVRKIIDAVFPDQPEDDIAGDIEERAALEAAESVPPLSTLGKNKEDLVVAAENTNPAAANESLTEALKKRFMDRDSDIVPSTVDQLTKEPPKGDPDDDTPDAPKTRKQRMLESVDMISELFGIREKDKAEDMYDLMATIGFAMASGESPNAMKNIADAFLVGAQMKRADKKEDKKLDQAIRTLAVKDVLEQESDERALAQLLAKEERQDERTLALYADKLRIKEELDPTSPAGRYLSSELGDAILGVYADVLKDETINPDDKGAEFFKRVGDKNATQFLGLTGFSAMGGGVGAGVTPTQSKLDFGES